MRAVPDSAGAMSPPDPSSPGTLLALHGVHVRFDAERDWLGRPRAFVHAVNGVDLTVRRGETVGLVGESGCGKSTLGQAILRLLPLREGRVVFDGHDLGGLGRPALRGLRRRFQIVFQDPQSSLDPRMRMWQIIAEPLVVNRAPGLRVRDRAEALAAQVGLGPEQLDRFPHEFSGGQRQRIAIARALALAPELIVLDEPTSSLDVSVQAQILNLLLRLQRDLGLTYLFISHDVSVIRHISDRIAVMYLGQIVEIGQTEAVLEHPSHPYTRTLLTSVPRLDRWVAPTRALERTELPSSRVLPRGCYFHDRCVFAGPGCDRPQTLSPLGDDRDHLTRCHRAGDLPDWTG